MAQRDYQRLVKLVARLFYAEGVPPPEEPFPDEEEQAYKPRKKGPAGPCLGLGVIVLDALTRREWVQEDYIPRPFVEGEARDLKPPGLAQQLRLPPKLLRQTLRYFESEEQLVRREHRQEKANRRKRPGDIVHDAAAESMLAGQDAVAVAEDGDGAPKQHTHSYCCLDYPSFVDVVQLKLWIMRGELKGAVEDAEPVAGYACRSCGATYTSMDAVRLVDHTGEFVCEDCGAPVEQQFEGGQMGGEEERRARKAKAKALLAQFERTTKPVRELLERLKNSTPPDYGPLQDWQVAKQQAAALKQRRANKSGQRDIISVNVELDLTTGAVPVEEVAEKAQPAWMKRDGIASRAEADAAGDAEAAAAAAREAEERKQTELAYAQAWMAKMAEAEAERERAAAAAPSPDGTPLRDVKRLRTQGGWAQVEASPVKTEALPEVKVEVKSEVKSEVKAEVKAEPASAAACHRDADWEDVGAAKADAESDDEAALEWESD